MILYFFIFYNSIIDNSDHLTILIIITRELFEIIKLMFEIIKYHLPMIHCHADDSQVYISFSPNDRAEQLAVMRDIEDYIRDVRFWMLNLYLTGETTGTLSSRRRMTPDSMFGMQTVDRSNRCKTTVVRV